MLTIRRRSLSIRMVRKVFYTCARPLQKGYWFLFRPDRPGAKVFIFHRGKILLVRIGYAHKKWVLPGGGIERGEESFQAAVREAREETGLVLTDPVYVGERMYTNQYKKVTVFYYTATVPTEDVSIDGQEIINAGWFSLDSLPSDIPPRLPDELTMYTNWKHGTI